MDVDVELVGSAKAVLKPRRLFKGVGSKLVPLIVMPVPGIARVVLRLVIVGGPPARTLKFDDDVAEPPGAETVIGPVVAPTGTFTTNWFAAAETTVAEVPLNVTVFWLRVALKSVP
jgi:hypothetical protein